MKSIAAQKEELLLACQIQRETLQLEWNLLQYRWNRFQSASRLVPQAFKWAAPVLGFLIARGLGRSVGTAGGKLSKAVLLYKAWQWGRLLLKRAR